MIFIALLYVVLAVFGAKATWNLVSKVLLSITSGELVFIIILFVLVFLVVSPIMGIIIIIKLLIANSQKSNNTNSVEK